MRAVFLDRDGVINENRVDHVKSWDEFDFIPGALAAIRHLHQAGLPVFVVTNQAIVGRGLASPTTLDDIHARMISQVRAHGGAIQDVRYCPHRPDEACACRKPQPGMLLDLAADWQIDLSASYLIGDAWTDIAAGRGVNCTCILVRTGRGAEQAHLPEAHEHPADYVAADIWQAVCWLLEREGAAPPHYEAATQPRRPAVEILSALATGR